MNNKYKRRSAKEFLKDLKGLFSHDNKRSIREQGNMVLGGPYNSTSKYIPSLELFTIGDFVRAVQMIGNSVASVDFQIYKDTKGKWEYDKNNIWNTLLNKKPNQEMTPHEMKKNIVWNIFIYGRASLFIERDPMTKEPIALIPIFSNYLKREVIDGVPQYKITGSSSTETSMNNVISSNVNDVIIPNEDLIWLPYETWDNIQNVEFRTLYSFALNKIRENDKSTLNALANDAGLAMFVKLKDSSNAQQQEEVAANLKESTRQMKDTGMFAFVYDEKIEIESNNSLYQKPIGIEMRKYVTQEIAAKFGIPPSFLGVEIPNTSSLQLNKFYLDNAIKPILNNIISRIQYTIFGDNKKYKIKYSLIELSGINLMENMEVITKGINSGVMTINEAREMIGLNPRDDGDKLYANGTLLPIDKLGTRLESEAKKFDSEADKNLAEVESIQEGKPLQEENFKN